MTALRTGGYGQVRQVAPDVAGQYWSRGLPGAGSPVTVLVVHGSRIRDEGFNEGSQVGGSR